VWLAASTHKGEEELIARVHQSLASDFPGLLTIIVPRHPGRGAEIAQILAGASLAVTRRALCGPPPVEGVWIADTLGELGLFYRLVRPVFLGKSFVGPGLGAGGGQNPLEPARLGCAIAVGPATRNFDDAVALLQKSGGLATVADETALAAWVSRMLRDPALALRTGEAALATVQPGADLPRQLALSLAESC